MNTTEPGIIKVFTGPMFAIKTGALIIQYDCSTIAKRKVAAFKPSIDGRFEQNYIVARTVGEKIPAHCIQDLKEINEYDAQDYFIDEFQFLKGDIRVIQKMANHGKNFYIDGLDMTAEGKPFPIMSKLLAIADIVEKRTAVCLDCDKQNATISYCLVEKKGDILVDQGGNAMYIPLCRTCWQKRMDNRRNKKHKEEK